MNISGESQQFPVIGQLSGNVKPTQASAAVLNKALEAEKQQGAEVVDMIKKAGSVVNKVA